MALENQSFLTLNNTSNQSGTSRSQVYQPDRYSWYWITLGFICVISSLGNAFVILLICAKKSFRKKVSPNWFILSLGISDLLIATFNIPLHFICSFTTMCTHSNIYILYCFASEFLTASTTNVCLLTLDIYLAVFHPFSYQNLMSPSKSLIFLFSGWVFSTIVNIPLFVSTYTRDTQTFLADQIITIVFYSFSGAFLIYAFCRIMVVVKTHKKEIEKHRLQIELNVNSRVSLTNSSSCTPSTQIRRRNRDGTITATGVVTASFIVCSLIWQYKLVHFAIPQYVPMNLAAIDFADLVIYFNCTMNFIVYALLRNDLRGELKRAFKKISNRRDSTYATTLTHLRPCDGPYRRQSGSLAMVSTKDDLFTNGVH